MVIRGAEIIQLLLTKLSELESTLTTTIAPRWRIPELHQFQQDDAEEARRLPLGRRWGHWRSHQGVLVRWRISVQLWHLLLWTGPCVPAGSVRKYAWWEERELTWRVAVMFAAWKLYLSAVSSPTTPLVSLNLAGKFSCMRIILSRTTDWGGALWWNRSDGGNGPIFCGRRRWNSSMACSKIR